MILIIIKSSINLVPLNKKDIDLRCPLHTRASLHWSRGCRIFNF